MAGDVDNRSSRTKHIGNFASLAAFIKSDKDYSSSIYRRFDRLTARDLLYRQSELVELEARQHAFDKEDLYVDMTKKASSRNWTVFADRAKDPSNDYERTRMELAMEIRDKLKEYHEAVLQQEKLNALKRPSRRALEAFRNAFNNVGKFDTPVHALEGSSSTILNDQSDLLSLQVNANEDRLSDWLQNYFPFIFVEERQGPSGQLAYLSERRIQLCAVTIYVLLAAILLFGPIYNLYFVKSDQKRLGLIALYTIIFAACVGLLTNARRSEIFGACAAYAAVLVVFVSGDLGNGTA